MPGLAICPFRWLRGMRKSMEEKTFLVAGAALYSLLNGIKDQISEQSALLVAKCHHRVHAQSAPCRDVGRKQSDASQARRNDNERREVSLWNVK